MPRIRRALIGAGASALLLALTPATAFADGEGDDGVDPSGYCDGHAEPIVDGVLVGNQAGTGGSASLCIDGVGAVDASGDASGGYVVADGDGSNPGAASGYIGADTEEGALIGDSCNVDHRDQEEANQVTVEGLASIGSGCD